MKHNYVIINRFPKTQKYEEPTFVNPNDGFGDMEVMEAPAITRQEIIGVINASMLEGIQWTRREEQESGPGQVGVTYDLAITYLNSSQVSDGHLQITNFNPYDAYGFVNAINAKFPTTELQSKMMNNVVSGISKAIMKTYESNSQTVVHYYPPFDLGPITLVSTTNPYDDASGEKGDLDFFDEILAMQAGAA